MDGTGNKVADIGLSYRRDGGKEKKMKRYTESQLWKFIGRADTHEKVRIAEDFITRLDYLDLVVWNDMMIALSQISRELYRAE